MTNDPQNPTPDHMLDHMPDHMHELAAQSLRACFFPFNPDMPLSAVKDALESARDQDKDGQTLLDTQTRVLDSLFHRLITRALNPTRNMDGTPQNYVNGEYMDLALRAQKQCRTTLDALRVLHKNQKNDTNELKDPED